MKPEIELLNREINECLKTAQAKVNKEKVSQIGSALIKGESSFDFHVRNPVSTPCNLLVAIASELGVSNQLSEILFSYQLRIGLHYFNGRKG